ncbi:MAG: PIN domain-containing protein [Bifidobacteriaceae bacterium]|nr:PIN domain-containing protein [Bifidobacteriaceae bacterium]
MTGHHLAAVDSSVVIAWQNRDEPFHARAVEMISAWPDLVMHTLNVAEVLAGLRDHDWTLFLDMMRRDGFTFHDTTAQALARAKRDTGLRMPDACVIAVAAAHRARAVLSFDQRLLRAAHAHGFDATPVTSDADGG